MGSPFLPSSLRVSRRRSGFTLIELLVVIVIIAILAALLFPVLGKALRSGRQSTSVSNLRQWGEAFHASWQEHDGEMPADGKGAAAEGEEAWFNRLPPKLSMQPLSTTTTRDLPAFGARSLWVNPGAPTMVVNGTPFFYGYNDYLSSSDEPTMRFTRVVHPSKTALLVEKLPDASPVGNPETIRSFFGGVKDPNDPEAICNVLFIDGHVSGVSRKTFVEPHSSTASSEDELRGAAFLWLPFVGALP